jgi:hypothetical protein
LPRSSAISVPSHAAIIAARETAKPAQRLIAEPPKTPRVDRPARENSEIGIADLFFSADSAARRMLLTSLGNADTEAPQSVLPLETIRALEAAALGRDRGGFTTLIESALSLTRTQAERFVQDDSGEPLLVAAKALAMPPVVLQRVLMFIDPAIGESVARVFDLAAFYERMSADAAHKIIDSVRGREPVRARKPQHRPMYYDDESGRSRRATATRRVGDRDAGASAHRTGQDSAHDVIEEGPPGAVLDLDDPQIRIVADLPRQIGLDVGFGLSASARSNMRSPACASSNADCGAGP